MIATPTLFDLHELDRTLYEYLRLALVADNKLPDLAQIIIDYPDPLVAKKKYTEAQEALGDDLIQLFGVGSIAAKGKSLISRVVIIRDGISPGVVGGQHRTFFKAYQKEVEGELVDRFSKHKYPDTTSNLTYDIRIISDSTETYRYLETLLLKVFGQTRSIKTYASYRTPSDKFATLRWTGFASLKSDDEGIESSCKYMFNDIWLNTAELVREDILPLSSVSFNFDLAGYDGIDNDSVEGVEMIN